MTEGNEQIPYISPACWTEARGMERLLGRDPENQQRAVQLLLGLHTLLSERSHPDGEAARSAALQGIRSTLAYLAVEMPEWIGREALENWRDSHGASDLPYTDFSQDVPTAETAERLIQAHQKQLELTRPLTRFGAQD